MAFDFEPNIEPTKEVPEKEPSKSNTVVEQENALVMGNAMSSDVVTVNNLLNITQSHIDDDNECRRVIDMLSSELNNSIHLMSIKEITEYLKVKLREREFHVECVFKAYAFIQRSEYAREMFVGSHRKERIIEASDRKRINGLLSMLNNTNGSSNQ